MQMKPWVVGVLSTDYDLHEYRESVCKWLERAGYSVSAFERPEFPVSPSKHSHDDCLEVSGRVDIALVIINKRGGSLYCGEEENGRGLTSTEAEYLTMVNSGKPTYAFVHEKSLEELHKYLMEFNSFKRSNPTLNEHELKEAFDESYICTYVEKVETLHFIQMIQNAHERYKTSNWMARYLDITSLINAIDGVLKGYSKFLLQNLSELQKDNVLNKHSSTSIGMSLRDVFSSSYYIEAPYTIESGKALIPNGELSLSDSIDSVLEKKQSVLIYGEAGYGKTTVIAKCFVDRVEKKSTDYEIPLYLSLRNKGNCYSFTYSDYLREEFAEKMQKMPYPHLDLSSIIFCFYCDGFDELTESLSEEDIDRIRETEIFKSCLVLTCRQQYVTRYLKVHAFSDIFAVRIRMDSWGNETITQYISNYYKKRGTETDKSNRLIEQVNNNFELQNLINCPLLVTMFLSYVDRKGIDSGISEITSVELFSDWMEELANREHSKITMASTDIIEVWKITAWHLYLCRRDNKMLADEDLKAELEKMSNDMNTTLALSTLDSLFDRNGHEIRGAFHEQFMEYLVADLLVDACLLSKEPYPVFLIYVLRPEMNRYFRGIWNKLSKIKKTIVFEAIQKQYTDNVGKKSSEAIATRVHAAYHMCRLDCTQRNDAITQAFNVEKHLSVLLSLYFGAIKLGHLDEEECFYSLLSTDSDFSKANRGYHLVYYADMIPNGSFPYLDDNESTWNGTLNAIRNHFSNKKLSYFYMQRVDLFTLRDLISARRNVDPLTEKILEEIEENINKCPFINSAENKNYMLKIQREFNLLKKEYEKYYPRNIEEFMKEDKDMSSEGEKTNITSTDSCTVHSDYSDLAKVSMERKIKVAITYAWDGDDYNNSVMSFCQMLRDNGYDAQMDKMLAEQKTAIEYNEMMSDLINKANKVIVFLSKKYKEKADNFTGGVGKEYRMILNQISTYSRKFIFVTTDDESFLDITPAALGNIDIIRLQQDVNWKTTLFGKLSDYDINEFGDVANEVTVPKSHKVTSEEWK